MKCYELAYLISPELAEEELKNFTQKIKDFLQEEGRFLDSSSKETLINKKLGYPIKKKVQGYLTTLNFYLEPEKLKNLENKLKSETQILRYMLLAKKPLPRIPEKKAVPIGIPSSQKKIIKPKEKVELKEIEEKLEEILGE